MEQKTRPLLTHKKNESERRKKMETQIRKILEGAKARYEMTEEQYKALLQTVNEVISENATESEDHDELIEMIKEMYGEI